MQETSLHARLKQFYIQDGGFSETWVDGYLIDVVKDGLLIEIQTGNFSALRAKLTSLIPTYPMRIVYPIPMEKYILTKNQAYSLVSRRRSPKKGRIEYVFNELIYIPQFISHPNFSMEILLTGEEEERIDDGKGSWRRHGISILDRRLVSIFQRTLLEAREDFAAMLPRTIGSEFTNLELAGALKLPKRLASKMTYCLAQMHVVERGGKKGRAFVYHRLL
jgi:hypothetical protein